MLLKSNVSSNFPISRLVFYFGTNRKNEQFPTNEKIRSKIRLNKIV